MEAVHTEIYKGKKLEVYYSDFPWDPREDENHFNMATKHPRYKLGEEKIADPIDWLCEKLGKREGSYPYNNDTLRSLEEQFQQKYLAKKLYLMDHSSLTISTTPFYGMYGHFDSSQVGYIYCSLDEARENWNLPKNAGWNRKMDDWRNPGEKITLRDACERILEAEIKLFQHYLNGEVYSYIYDKDGDSEDSCGGFIGEFDEVLEAMKDNF